MTGAELVTLALPVGEASGLVVETAAGEQAAQVCGLTLAPTTLAAKVYAHGQTISSDNLSDAFDATSPCSHVARHPRSR